MPDTRSIDPELQAVLRAMPRTRYGAMDLDDLPGTRALLATATAQMNAGVPRRADVITRDVAVPREDGDDLVLRVHRPDAAGTAAPALLWFHAGGQILGAASDDDLYLAQLAAQTGIVVIAVDYRLAPEHRAPAAAVDGLTAYRAVLSGAVDPQLDAARVLLGGASGGGAPALATALMVRDLGLPLPAALTLLYPMVDDRNTTASSRAITDVGVWDRPANLLAWSAVLGDRVGTDAVDAYSAPARAADLGGLPPVFVAVGEVDLFRDEDVALAVRMLEAGGRVELHLYAGGIHAFDRFAPDSGLTEELNRSWQRFMARIVAAGQGG